MLREEAAGWAEEVVDLARAARHPRLIVLLTWAASSAWAFQRLGDAKRFGHEAIALLDDATFEPFVWAYTDLAQVAIFEGDEAAAEKLVKAGAAHPADRQDRFCTASGPSFLTRIGRHDEAMQTADFVVAQVTAAGMPASVAMALWGKGLAFAEADRRRL